MNRSEESGFTPRAPRFKVANAEQIDVTILRTEEGDTEPVSATLIDVSQHGTKLRVPVNLRFEEALQLQITVPDAEIEYRGIASVRYIRAVDEEHWVVGCAVAPPLSDETFSFLATTAGQERRRFRRLNIAAEATVRRQGQTDGTAASLHNLSSGGFCFSSTDHYESGERVQLTINGNDGDQRMIEARICWQVDSADGSIAGCQFSSSASYAELCACLTEQPVLASNGRVAEEPTSKLVLTAAVLAMFVPPMMTLMLQANKVSANAGENPVVASMTDDRAVELPASAESRDGEFDDHPREEPADADLLALLIAESQALDVLESPESAAATAPMEPSTEAPTEVPTEREWVDNTGKYRTVAELVEVTDEHIVLLKPDGKQSKVPWHRLSEVDQAFARDWRKATD
ncbi:MAG: PilZ domain-containing protein [Planctomycetota bacterium]